MKRIGLCGLALLVSACSGTGQPEFSYSAFATPIVRSDIDVGEWRLTLEQATVAFGPAYFCASATGESTLCGAAIAEILQVSVVDALDTTPQPLGDVHGFQGTIRSASYDHGIHWFLTESEPSADHAAPGGHSAVFVGEARRGAQSMKFEAYVDVRAAFAGQRAVTRILPPTRIEHDDVRLDVEFDVGAWLANVDFDKPATAGADRLVVEPGSADHSAIVHALANTAPPKLEWSGSGLGTP